MFLWLNKQLFYLFYILCSFTLRVCGEKNILPNLTNSQEPEPFFLAPWSRSRSKKIPGAGARAACGKKSGAGAGAGCILFRDLMTELILEWKIHLCIKN